jgi:hypothetical protein
VNRSRIITELRALASKLASEAEGSQWHLFGSVDRNQCDAEDVDLMIVCISDLQADALRQAIDQDALSLPLHLSFMTFDEAAEIAAERTQRSSFLFCVERAGPTF